MWYFSKGTLSKEVLQLQNLRALNTRQTALSGNLPSTKGLKISGQLRALDIGAAQYSGALPADWPTHPGLQNLRQIKLENSSLSGPVPFSWTTKHAFNADKQEGTFININNTKLCWQKYPLEGAFKDAPGLYSIPLCQNNPSKIVIEIQVVGFGGVCVKCKDAKQHVLQIFQDTTFQTFWISSGGETCIQNCSSNQQNLTLVTVVGHGYQSSEPNIRQTLREKKPEQLQQLVPNFIYQQIAQPSPSPPPQNVTNATTPPQIVYPTTTTKDDDNGDNDNNNTGLIIALAILGFIILALIAVLVIVFILKRRQWKQLPQQKKNESQSSRQPSPQQEIRSSCDGKISLSGNLITVQYGKNDVLVRSGGEKQAVGQTSNLSLGFQELYYSTSSMITIPKKIKTMREFQVSDSQVSEFGSTDINVDIDRDLMLLSQLGCGGFGAVYKALWRTRQGAEKTVAVKILNRDKLSDRVTTSERTKVFNAFYEEINTMLRLRHPGIVHFYGACLKPPALALLMEYMDGGSLESYLYMQEESTITYDEILAVLYKITLVLCYLHPGILHGDIKPQNILLDKHGNIKLADFGLSQIKSINRTLSFENAMGTPAYSAPEVWSNCKCSTKSDIYQLGLVAWEMVAGERPWKECSSLGQIVQKVVIQKARPEVPVNCRLFLAKFIQDCWADDPKLRPTAEQLRKRLEDEKAKGIRQTV